MSDFDFLKYFDLAKDLQDSEDEASLRSSISRAYYAVFHEAKEIISEIDNYEKIPTPSDKINIHWWLINYFRSRGQSVIFEKLRQLKTIRNQADYDSLPHISKREASSAIIETEKILKLLKSVK